MNKQEYEAAHGVTILNWSEITLKTKGEDAGSPTAGSLVKIRCRDCGSECVKVLTPKVLSNGHYGRCKACSSAIGSIKKAKASIGRKHSSEDIQRIKDGWAKRGGDQGVRNHVKKEIEKIVGPILNWNAVEWTASDKIAWKSLLSFKCFRCGGGASVGYRGMESLKPYCNACRLSLGRGGPQQIPPTKPPREKKPKRVPQNPGHSKIKSEEWKKLQSKIQQEKKELRPSEDEKASFECAFGTKITNWDSITVISRKTHHGWPRYRESLGFICTVCGRPGSKLMTDGILSSCDRTKCRSCIAIENMNNQGGRSKAEVAVEDYIKSLGIETQSSVAGLVPGYEVDVYVPEKRIGFEYCDLFWHEESKRGQDYHIKKLEAAEARGVRLVQIFEDEWVNHQEIVKSKIKSILGFSSDKVFARSCSPIRPSAETINDFLEENHIQGSGACSAGYGLEYDGKLVAVMTFVKSRAMIGAVVEGEYELMRFATSRRIVGGASRLLSAFRRDYPKAVIVSYADRRWSRGGVYEQLGFKLDHKTQANYWYIQGLERFHRANFTKGSLVSMGYDESKTEREIMEERGMSRIWDCGSLVYRLDPEPCQQVNAP